jgi:hypothetical protein
LHSHLTKRGFETQKRKLNEGLKSTLDFEEVKFSDIKTFIEQDGEKGQGNRFFVIGID